jgi:predicted RNA-binding Zn ribbon-like protein
VVSELPRYQRRVDGLVLPIDVAGDPALDFCNTLAGWNAAEPREYLLGYDHLLVWAREAALVDARTARSLRERAEREPEAALLVLERAQDFRSALYAASTNPAAEAPWSEVAQLASAAAGAAVLTRDAPPGRRWRIPESAGLDLPLLEVQRAAGALLASTDLHAIRVCPGHDCGWLFLDPRGRRRWCTMAVCGNRAKARRHAARARRG